MADTKKITEKNPKNAPKVKPFFLPNLSKRIEAGIVVTKEKILFRNKGIVLNDSFSVKFKPIKAAVEVKSILEDCNIAWTKINKNKFLFTFLNIKNS